MSAARLDGEDLILELRVQPRASSNGFAGLFGERLRVRLNTPPVDGRANAALIEYLAEVFAVPRSRVQIERGHTDRNKRVRILQGAEIPAPLADLLRYD